MTTLNPCPFCGGEASIANLGYHGPAECYDIFVRCDDCDAQAGTYVVDRYLTEAEVVPLAIGAWNRRADLPPGYRWTA